MCAVRSSTEMRAIHKAPPQTTISISSWRNGARPAEAGVGHPQQAAKEFMKTNVSKWRTALAVTMGGAMLATSAITESAAGSPPPTGGADSIKAVQQALKDKGHDPGEVDGAMGPKTRAALRDYQQKEGLQQRASSATPRPRSAPACPAPACSPCATGNQGRAATPSETSATGAACAASGVAPARRRSPSANEGSCSC
jgi:hypothetical protein